MNNFDICVECGFEGRVDEGIYIVTKHTTTFYCAQCNKLRKADKTMNRVHDYLCGCNLSVDDINNIEVLITAMVDELVK